MKMVPVYILLIAFLSFRMLVLSEIDNGMISLFEHYTGIDVALSDYSLKETEGKIGHKIITTKSSTQYALYDDSDCEVLIDDYYHHPYFTIEDDQTGASDRYDINSDENLWIVLNGGLTKPGVYTMRWVSSYERINKCNSTYHRGAIIIDSDGNVEPQHLPELEYSSNIVLEHNGEEVVIPMYPKDVYTSYSDWNNDGHSDMFVYQPVAGSKGEYRVLMVDEQTGQPNDWFNNGEVIYSKEDIPSIVDDWTLKRDFIRKYSSDKIPTAEELGFN